MNLNNTNYYELLPGKIQVASVDIHIVLLDTEVAVENCRFGEFSSLAQEIRIKPGLKPYKLLDTLFHEIGHAIYWIYNIHDSYKEEDIVSIQSTAYCQIFRNNPKLLSFVQLLIDGEKGKLALQNNKDFLK